MSSEPTGVDAQYAKTASARYTLDTVLGLSEATVTKVTELIAADPQASPDLLELLTLRAMDEERRPEGSAAARWSWATLEKVATNPSLSQRGLGMLAEYGETAIAENPSVTTADLLILVKALGGRVLSVGGQPLIDASKRCRPERLGKVLGPPRWTPDLLHELLGVVYERIDGLEQRIRDAGRSMWYDLQWAIAKRSDLPLESAKLLWARGDQHGALRQHACPPAFFAQARDEPESEFEPLWLLALANPGCPPPIAREIFMAHREQLLNAKWRGADDDVVAAVLINPALPADVVAILVGTALEVRSSDGGRVSDYPQYPGLAEALLARPDLSAEQFGRLASALCRRGVWKVVLDDERGSEAHARQVPLSVVFRAGYNEEKDARLFIEHPKLPDDVLVTIVSAFGSRDWVAEALLECQRLPAEVFETLWQGREKSYRDVDKALKRRMAGRLDCPRPILEAMRKSAVTKDLATATLGAQARNDDVRRSA